MLNAFEIEDSEPIDRGILWQEAYQNLERNGGFDDEQDDDSCKSLFDEAEQWDEEIEARISARTRSSMSIEHGLAASGSFGRRMTTFYVMNPMKMLPEDGLLTSQRDSKGYIKPRGFKRRVRRFKMWCVLLTMAIVLTHTISKFEAEVDSRIVAWSSIVTACIGLLTCFRTSKVSFVLQVASVSFY